MSFSEIWQQIGTGTRILPDPDPNSPPLVFATHEEMECAFMLRLAGCRDDGDLSQQQILVQVRRDLVRLWWDEELGALYHFWEGSLSPEALALPFANLFPPVCADLFSIGLFMTKRDLSLSRAHAHFQPEVARCVERVAESHGWLLSAFLRMWDRVRALDFGDPFFEVLFNLFRMPPVSRELYDMILRLRRSISDGLLRRDDRDPEMSLVRRFVTLFGCQFPISRGIFANTFSDLFFGSIELGEWQFPKCHPMSRAERLDFPRWIKHADQRIRFCPKTVTGVNGGLRIVWDNGSRPRSFFTKLWSHTRPKPLRACERRYEWAHATHGYGPRPTETPPSSQFDGDIFLDFREMAIYMLLEAFGAGPSVSFLLDGYSAGSFHIVTAEVENAVFSPKPNRYGRPEVTNEQRQEYASQYSANPVAFIETSLLVVMLGLNDCHRDNFCSGSTSSTGGRSTLQIIDFVPPGGLIPGWWPTRSWVLERIRCSHLLPESAFPLNEKHIEDAIRSLNEKLSNLQRREIPIAVYPPIEGQRPLQQILDDENCRKLIRGDNSMTCSKFILDIEGQIRNLFFERKVGKLDGRTPGELFGFTDVEQIWTAEQFDSAVAAVAKANFGWTDEDFDSFLKSVMVQLEQDPSHRKQEVRHTSVNYALAQLRWLSIWLEWQVPSVMDCFVPQDAHVTSP
jgi:hypothetical protein